MLLGVLTMHGCGGGAGPGGSGAPGEQPSSEGPASPSLELATQQPTKSGLAAGTYVGVLGADTIEGGCTYIQTADGRRYEIVPPDGWELRAGAAEFVAPDGTVVARAGDTVTVRGHEADMVSICQIGPIIQAVDIVSGG